MNTVVSNPKKQAKNVELKYKFVLRFRLKNNEIYYRNYFQFVFFMTYLWSNLNKKAINIPGITISPKPNIAKLLAAKTPFSNKS